MTLAYGVHGAQVLHVGTNGIDLHAIGAGPSRAPLLILLHGFPEFWYGWRRQIEPLAASGLRIVVPDLRGYNLSSKPEGIANYTLDVLADDVLGLADALGYARFAVVGHDWGGVLAWHLAGRDPERIARAAVLNAPHPATMRAYARTRPSQLAKSWYVAFFQLPRVPEWLLGAADCAWLRSALVRTSRPGAFGRDDLERYRDSWARPGALTAMLNWYRALRLADAVPRATPVHVPVRIIWGDGDNFLNRELAEIGVALCDRGEMFHMPDATHWVQHEDPAQVNRLLIEFLH